MNNSTQKKLSSRNARKLFKGFTAAYPTHSSIPSKYIQFVIPEPEKKGFNSQSKRFHKKLNGRFCYTTSGLKPICDDGDLLLETAANLGPHSWVLCGRLEHRIKTIDLVSLQDETPGPGFYDIIHQSPVFNSVSLSKKGTCAFPSLCARMNTIISKYPAANTYTIPSDFVSKKDFSTTCSSMFQLPGSRRVPRFETPAPNRYNTSITICKQTNNVCARAGFMSKTKREFFRSPGSGPAPGQYDINESLVKQSPKMLISCFKSKTDRGLKIMTAGPGPGYYNPNDHIKVPRKALIPRNPTLNFSAQPLPLPPKQPFPGPGQYEIVDYEGPPKHFISSASFVSTTERWTAAPADTGLPGPATYRPEFPGKQSFLYNEDNKWIPVL